MKTQSTLPEIRPEAFAKAREKLGLSTKELGVKACLSRQHIEQLENGEQTVFYSAQNKFTAAKKVANLLGLTSEEAFDFGMDTPTLEEILPDSSLEKSKPEKQVTTDLNHALVNSIQVEEPVISSLSSDNNKTNPSEPSSKKNIMLILGLLVVAVFSIINLRPLFFPPKAEEVFAVKEAAPESAPAAAPTTPSESVVISTPTPALVTAAVTPPQAQLATSAPVSINAVADVAVTCPTEDSATTSYKPETPRKQANMVYVLAKSKQVVCVVDATGKKQNIAFEPGVGNSFYGKPPFKVLTDGLMQVDIFFQGLKVRPDNMDAKVVMLQPAEFVISGNPTDAEVR
jgi:transcriptional regulator with XRE-family HTH domain